MLICRPDIRLRLLLPTAYVVWLLYWLANMYWIIEVTLPGYIAFFLVHALYGPLLAFCVRYVRGKKWPLISH